MAQRIGWYSQERTQIVLRNYVEFALGGSSSGVAKRRSFMQRRGHFEYRYSQRDAPGQKRARERQPQLGLIATSMSRPPSTVCYFEPSRLGYSHGMSSTSVQHSRLAVEFGHVFSAAFRVCTPWCLRELAGVKAPAGAGVRRARPKRLCLRATS
jgi:hypothetical protein